MYEYIELTSGINETALREIFIAKLAAVGAEGFEEEKNLLKAYFQETTFNKDIIDEIFLASNIQYTTKIIANRNWNELWESNFQPVQVDEFCVIRAEFHPAVPGVKYDIIINPKMSFGTGHHATTFMMIEAMSRIYFFGKSVFDYGTGTGVLAILAEKSGAFPIIAIDNDDRSIENAEENININKCYKILVFKNICFFDNSFFEIILANINRNIILDNLSAMKQHLLPNGVLLLSGLLTGDYEIIMEAAEKNKLNLKNRTERNGWICLELINHE